MAQFIGGGLLMSNFIQCLLWFLPWCVRRRVLQSIFGWEIDASARIGFSFINASSVRMAAAARIGHLTVVKGLRCLDMSEFSRVGNLNWITGVPDGSKQHFIKEVNRNPSLIIECHAALTHRHLIDCTDMVTIGAYTTFAGWGSQILTHAIDLHASRQSCAPVYLGRYCFIGTRVVILKGCNFPDRSVLAAGAVLAHTMMEPDMIYGGVPASAVRILCQNDKYFVRTSGYID